LIDKYSNVGYIHNLYNLFNTANNKYKDFKRTIDNKKSVYEKLLSTNKIDELTEDEKRNMNEMINKLQEQKDDLLLKFNSIMVDIKNPKTLIILDTDYKQLINELVLLNTITDEEHYGELLSKYNEIKYLLKDYDIKIINKLKSEYKECYENEINYDNIKTPCELSILEDEEHFLKSHLIVYNSNHNAVNDNDNHNCNDNDVDKLKSKLEELYIQNNYMKKNKKD